MFLICDLGRKQGLDSIVVIQATVKIFNILFAATLLNDSKPWWFGVMVKGINYYLTLYALNHPFVSLLAKFQNDLESDQPQVDGETRQKGSTREMIFKIPYLISHISSIMTLLEGDVILTGTCFLKKIYQNFICEKLANNSDCILQAHLKVLVLLGLVRK